MTVNALHVQTPWLWEGNVFSHVSVILSVHRGGGFPCDHYPWCLGPHYTGSPWPWPWLKYTFSAPLDIRPGTSCPSPTPLLLTSGGHHWRPVQTCSPEIPIPSGVTSGGGHWSTYGFKWAVRILLECFLGFLPTSREGNVFRSVCRSVNHSVHKGSGLPIWGELPPGGLPPLGVCCLLGVCPTPHTDI